MSPMIDINRSILSTYETRRSGNQLREYRALGSSMLLERAVIGSVMKSLKKLTSGISGLEIHGKSKIEVSSLATDSRRVGPGSLFFALPGLRTDGHHFIEEAIDRGAVAIVCQKECWVPPNVSMVQVDNMREAVATIASRFYKNPQKELRLTGMLGTSGKTVTAALLKHFLAPRGRVGMLGTIHYEVGARSLPAHRTTPEPVELYALLAQIRDFGCKDAIIEVSSHGIDQDRVAAIQFANLVLLNLSPEHLNYHGSLQNYIDLERRFIEQQAAGLQTLVAGLDDPAVRGIVAGAGDELRKKVLTFGCSDDAVIRADNIRYSNRDTRFDLSWPGGSVKLVSPLLGEFNLQNLLAAIACGYSEGIDPVEMGAALLSFERVRGRLEPVEMDLPFNVIIDYMHTEASYEKGLTMLKGLTPGRLITVFGCGGNRDASARPLITGSVARLSDRAIATADNPRYEDLDSIFADMRKGNSDLTNLQFIPDRREAIAAALEMAKPGDTVLIAGKGHETFQEYGDCVVPFDDRSVAREILKNMEWQHR